MDRKTFILAALLILIAVPAAMAAYNAYRHSSFTIGDGKDIDLNSQLIGNGSVKDLICVSGCTGFNATGASGSGNVSYPIDYNNASQIINRPDITDTFSFLIYRNNTMIFAKNGSSGNIDYSGTNASIVIQAALNELSGKPALMVFKSGSYNIDVPLLQYGNIMIKGESWQNTILLANSTGMDAVITLNQGSSRQVLEDIMIDGNSKAKYAINFSNTNGARNIRFNRISTKGGLINDIVLDGNEDSTITNSIIEGPGFNWSVAAGNIWVQNSYINGTLRPNCQVGFFSQVTFANSQIRNYCSHIYFDQIYFNNANFAGGSSEYILQESVNGSVFVKNSALGMINTQGLVGTYGQDTGGHHTIHTVDVSNSPVYITSGTAHIVAAGATIYNLNMINIKPIGGGTITTKTDSSAISRY